MLLLKKCSSEKSLFCIQGGVETSPRVGRRHWSFFPCGHSILVTLKGASSVKRIGEICTFKSNLKKVNGWSTLMRKSLRLSLVPEVPRACDGGALNLASSQSHHLRPWTLQKFHGTINRKRKARRKWRWWYWHIVIAAFPFSPKNVRWAILKYHACRSLPFWECEKSDASHVSVIEGMWECSSPWDYTSFK